jgi:hypothetical protein
MSRGWNLAWQYRQGTAFVLDVCRAEAALASSFFPCPNPSSAQESLVETICNSLADVLRPQYIQLHSIDDLADLVDVLRLAVHADAQTPGAGAARQLLQPTVARITCDVQERLLFRASGHPPPPPLPLCALSPFVLWCT